MMGMIKKDLYMIRNNYKALIISLILYLFYSIMFELNMSFFLPFMGLMTCISTINYDEYNNWHAYASSLPQGRINIIKSKYIIGLLSIIILSIIGIISSYIIGNIKGSFNFIDEISGFAIIIMALIIMMSVLFPVLFKLGYEKGRIAMMLISVSAVGLLLLFTKVIKINLSIDFISFLSKYIILIATVISIIFVTISYLISRRIYMKKEF